MLSALRALSTRHADSPAGLRIHSVNLKCLRNCHIPSVTSTALDQRGQHCRRGAHEDRVVEVLLHVPPRHLAGVEVNKLETTPLGTWLLTAIGHVSLRGTTNAARSVLARHSSSRRGTQVSRRQASNALPMARSLFCKLLTWHPDSSGPPRPSSEKVALPMRLCAPGSSCRVPRARIPRASRMSLSSRWS